MRSTAFCIICLLLAAGPALAYDDLITLGDPYVLSPREYRAAGRLVYMSASEAYDADGETGDLADDSTMFRVPLYGTYGLMRNMDVFAVVPIVSWDDGTDSESGLGDVWLGARYAFMPDNLLTVRGALNLDSGDDDKGLGQAGGIGIDLGAISETFVVPDKVGVRGQAGIRSMGEDSDTDIKPGLGIYAQGTVSYMLPQVDGALTGSLEFMTTGDREFNGTEMADSGTQYLELGVGGAATVMNNIGLNANIFFTLSGTNVNKNTGLILSAMYSF